MAVGEINVYLVHGTHRVLYDVEFREDRKYPIGKAWIMVYTQAHAQTIVQH